MSDYHHGVQVLEINDGSRGAFLSMWSMCGRDQK